jgi:MoaA/NifB/PqqE/SkfB family radical SAM enzyme
MKSDLMTRPILLHYFITYQCNCRCKFCSIWQNPVKKHALTADVKRNLTEAFQLGTRFVDFTGGEPLLHPNLCDMLKYAKKLGYRTSITTNCYHYPSMARELKGLVDYLHFSLDSALQQQHDNLRGASVFESVMHSIDLARSLDEKPDLLYTVTCENFDQFSILSELCRKIGLVLLVNPVFSHLQKIKLSRESVTLLNNAWYKPYVYVNKAIHHLKANGGNSIRHPTCRAITSTIVISPLNELLLPCFHFCQLKIPIEKSLQKILGTPEYRKYYQRQGQFDFCDGCSINCYFDPSFIYKMDRYLILSLFAKAKYLWDKKVRRTMEKKLHLLDYRPVKEILDEIILHHSL